MLTYKGNALLKLYQETPSKVIRLTRTAKGLSQKEMAAKLGVDRSVLCRYESGAYMPPGDILVRCLRLIGVDLVEMVRDDIKDKQQMVDQAAKMILKLNKKSTSYSGLEMIIRLGLNGLTSEKLRDILLELRAQLNIQ